MYTAQEAQKFDFRIFYKSQVQSRKEFYSKEGEKLDF